MQEGYSCKAEAEQAGMMPAKGSEDCQCWRTALLVGSVAGNAAFSFGLCCPGRVTDQITEDRRRYWRSRKWVGLRRRDGAGAVRAFLGRSFELRIVADDELTARVRAHPAMVLAVASATRRQSSLRILPHGQHGKQEGKAEHSQQQNGDQSTQ